MQATQELVRHKVADYWPDSRLSSHERNEIRSIRARDRQQYEAWLAADPDD